MQMKYLNLNLTMLILYVIEMSMFMAPTDPFEVLNIINSLKSKHSTGHDNISTSFLKDIFKRGN